MKIKLPIIFSLIVILFFAYFLYEARTWRLQARLYPLVIGIPALILGVMQLAFDIFGVGEKKDDTAAPVDYQFTQPVDPVLARRRTINIFSWIFGFVILIWLIGFAYAVPTMVFLYLKVQSRESWVISVVLTAAAWLLFWGLFNWLLSLPFPDGQLQIWLGLT